MAPGSYAEHGDLIFCMIKAIKDKLYARCVIKSRELVGLLNARQMQQALHYVEHYLDVLTLYDALLVVEKHCSNSLKERKMFFRRVAVHPQIRKGLVCINDALFSNSHNERLLINHIFSEFERMLEVPVLNNHLEKKLRKQPLSDMVRLIVVQRIAAAWGIKIVEKKAASSPQITESCRLCELPIEAEDKEVVKRSSFAQLTIKGFRKMQRSLKEGLFHGW